MMESLMATVKELPKTLEQSTSDLLERFGKDEVWNEPEISLFDKKDINTIERNDGENQEVRAIICRNESLADDVHPITGVPFEEKVVKDENGEDVRVVVPVFDSTFDAQLPDNMLQASDAKQFKECNAQLLEKVENDPEFAKKFTPEQVEQIKNGHTPDGYTWHHHEDTGKMQLVDSKTHNQTGHTGGKVIWGGGEEHR